MEHGSIEGRGGGVNGSDKSENEKKRTKGAIRRERRLEERNTRGEGGSWDSWDTGEGCGPWFLEEITTDWKEPLGKWVDKGHQTGAVFNPRERTSGPHGKKESSSSPKSSMKTAGKSR